MIDDVSKMEELIQFGYGLDMSETIQFVQEKFISPPPSPPSQTIPSDPSIINEENDEKVDENLIQPSQEIK